MLKITKNRNVVTINEPSNRACLTGTGSKSDEQVKQKQNQKKKAGARAKLVH